MTIPEHPRPSGRPTRRRWLIPALLLGGGVLAWVIALAAIVLVMPDSDAPKSDARPTRAASRSTLAAVTSEPPPTVTATATPTASPSPTHTPTGAPAAASNTTPASAPTDPPAEEPADAPVVVGGSVFAGSDTGDMPDESAVQDGGCASPDGWQRYIVQPGDTWFAFVLGAGGTITVDDLMLANCANNRLLQVGQAIYLPPGAADNAPSADPAAPAGAAAYGASGPRTPNCPCTIQVREGWRMEQIADAINASETLFTGADFLSVTGPGASARYDFVMDRPPGASMEGFLFPGTYTAQNDTTAEAFRDMLLDAFAANVSPQVRADAAAQGVSFYEALIIASITQRESYTPETQQLIASLFYNRLRDGNRLASTVPVSYALGGPGNWWPRVTGSNMEVESPYNTYTLPGLPPTPIDNPGQSAILAAVYPPQTNYYYHSAACDGGAAFAETYEEHLANLDCD
ncbi:MAG: endolytic transglycosylase MltG [Anaerolineae bacterium]|nr:endolytic transglycosylase MltG [Anaerolineae bacterium]